MTAHDPMPQPTARRRGNLGRTRLSERHRNVDPMRAYDRLPPALRAWMAGAALPWSAASCLAIWRRAPTPEEALDRLDRAERATLARAGTPGYTGTPAGTSRRI